MRGPLPGSTKVRQLRSGKTGETSANGDVAYWTYSAYGKLATHTDLGGQISTYSYDAYSGMLTSLTSLRPHPSPAASAGSLVAARDLRYEYDAAGRVRKIVDGGANTITEVTYDTDARRIRETLFQGNAVIRDTGIAYDALGRMVRIADPGHYTRTSYDAHRNRGQPPPRA